MATKNFSSALYFKFLLRKCLSDYKSFDMILKCFRKSLNNS